MYKIAYIAGFDFENSPAASNRFLSLNNVLDKNFQVTRVLTSYPLSKEYDDKTENWKIRNVSNKIQNLFIIFRLSYYVIKNANRFDTFIIYGGYAFYMLPFIILKPFFKYKVVYDSVEIYLPKGFLKTIFSPNTWNHLIGYNFLIRFFDGAICISSYIQEKHKRQGLKTVIVPPIFLNENTENEQNIRLGNISDNRIKLLFYGFPGKKDSLNNLVKVFLFNKSLAEKFEVTIIGLNSDQYKKYCNENGIFEFPENFIIKGKLRLDEVYKELTDTDFTFLQRPYTITTKAGFPSKLVESLFYKVPSVLNLTSDMDKYEIDKCSVVCKDDSVESLQNALTYVKNMNNQEITTLEDKCKIIYEKYFSTLANLDKIKIFIKNINNN
jgi:hypothetical protein